jgi:outer membrane immunogenic protein
MRFAGGLLLASALALGAAQSATAADMPVKAPVTRAPAAAVSAAWNGLYAGIEAGGAWSRFGWSHVNDNYFNTLAALVVGRDFSQTAAGVIGGGFAGYNYQAGALVVGVELSAAASNLRREAPSPFFPALDRYTSSLKWLATAVGRVGYASDRWLVYAKGGYAGADVQMTMFDFVAGIRAQSDLWAHGWTVGAGVEYMLGGGVILGLTYNYLDLWINDAALDCPLCGAGIGAGSPVVDGHIQVHTVMARLGFQFGR